MAAALAGETFPEIANMENERDAYDALTYVTNADYENPDEVEVSSGFN